MKLKFEEAWSPLNFYVVIVDILSGTEWKVDKIGKKNFKSDSANLKFRRNGSTWWDVSKLRIVTAQGRQASSIVFIYSLLAWRMRKLLVLEPYR
jgi:hypothetical protein